MTGRVTHGWKLSAAVLAIALTVAACGGTDLSNDTAGPTLRARSFWHRGSSEAPIGSPGESHLQTRPPG